MKVALLRKRYIDHGGAERYVANLARGLSDLGHEVHVYANEWKVDNKCKMQDARCKIKDKEYLGSKNAGKIIFHRVPIIKGLSFLEALSFAVNSKRLLKRERFDIIHSCERTIYQDVYRAGEGCHKEWLLRRAKVESPLKTMLVRLNPLHWTLLLLERKLFRANNLHVIANSRKRKEEIVRHYGVPDSKVKVIYTGLDSCWFANHDRAAYRRQIMKEYDLSNGDQILLFVGSGFKIKGLSYAIRALAATNRADLKLLVVGKGSRRKPMRLCRKLGVDSQVIFVGTTSQIEKFYSASDIFILPSVYEVFSSACLEAMACGLPIVTTKINGASEVIEAGRNGYVVETPWDIDALCRAIKNSLDLNRDRISEVNKDILADFSWEKHLEEMIAVYDSLVQARRQICKAERSDNA
jgi:UDP-glucose:(heptosyl)LPS alpha-1,3-glucosyltransferase